MPVRVEACFYNGELKLLLKVPKSARCQSMHNRALAIAVLQRTALERVFDSGG